MPKPPSTALQKPAPGILCYLYATGGMFLAVNPRRATPCLSYPRKAILRSEQAGYDSLYLGARYIFRFEASPIPGSLLLRHITGVYLDLTSSGRLVTRTLADYQSALRSHERLPTGAPPFTWRPTSGPAAQTPGRSPTSFLQHAATGAYLAVSAGRISPVHAGRVSAADAFRVLPVPAVHAAVVAASIVAPHRMPAAVRRITVANCASQALEEDAAACQRVTRSAGTIMHPSARRAGEGVLFSPENIPAEFRAAQNGPTPFDLARSQAFLCAAPAPAAAAAAPAAAPAVTPSPAPKTKSRGKQTYTSPPAPASAPAYSIMSPGSFYDATSSPDTPLVAPPPLPPLASPGRAGWYSPVASFRTPDLPPPPAMPAAQHGLRVVRESLEGGLMPPPMESPFVPVGGFYHK